MRLNPSENRKRVQRLLRDIKKVRSDEKHEPEGSAAERKGFPWFGSILLVQIEARGPVRSFPALFN